MAIILKQTYEECLEFNERICAALTLHCGSSMATYSEAYMRNDVGWYIWVPGNIQEDERDIFRFMTREEINGILPDFIDGNSASVRYEDMPVMAQRPNGEKVEYIAKAMTVKYDHVHLTIWYKIRNFINKYWYKFNRFYYPKIKAKINKLIR